MSRYTADSVDRVRDAVDMVALVEAKVELRRAGQNSYFGRCPFHDERTASFHVSPDEKLYHCFGCSESGGPFDFLMQTEGLDFKGALESLADRFGVRLESEQEDPAAAARRARNERLYALLTRAATYYSRNLWEAREASGAREYLLERGFSEETLREFRVGYAPRAWERLVGVSRQAGYSDDELLAAGLAQRRQGRPDDLIDRFRGRIMFPTADSRGRIRGFGARTMGLDRGPKYLNTSESDVYQKRRVLYGISLARAAAAKAGRIVLVEGYTDVIALHQAGIRNAVGIMGTSLTREQVEELVTIVQVLELCLDADGAGQEAMVRAAGLCADSKLELRVVPLPPGSDPGDVIAAEGVHALRDRVATSVPYVVFEVGRILSAAELGSAEGKDRAIAELRPALARLGPSVLRDELTRRAAGALELTEARLTQLLEAGAGRTGVRSRDRTPAHPLAPDPGPAPVADAVTPSFEHALRAERSFLAMCIAAPQAGEPMLAEIDLEQLLTSELLRRVALHLRGRLTAPLSGLPRDDDELARVVADLVARADRGGQVTGDQLEHSRLLLERALLDRRIARAVAARAGGINDLARERQNVLDRIVAVGSRIEQPH